MRIHLLLSACVSVVALGAATAQAVSIDLVTVGNPGNTPDTRVMSDGTSGYGSVGFNYQIGKYEITVGQYAEFLNAVARNDCYRLSTFYSGGAISLDGYVVRGIQRTGDNGSYSYAVADGWANRPVYPVNYGQAARFVNWLSNGQPTGVLTGNHALDVGLTEDGSYVLDYDTNRHNLGWSTVNRKPSATWVLPSEDEWYKAAYYDPNKNGPGLAGYWTYPTRSDDVPSNVLSATGTNNANFEDRNWVPTLGIPYWVTEVGAFSNSLSAYGTCDQAGNVWEWNDTNILVESDTGYIGSLRPLRGGDFGSTLDPNGPGDFVDASTRLLPYPLNNSDTDQFPTGFRVGYLPEPGMIALLVTAAFGLLVWLGWKVRD